MVAIVVYFESIHRAAAMDAAAMPAAVGEAMRSEARPPEIGEASHSEAMPPAVGEAMRSEAMPPTVSEAMRSEAMPAALGEAIRSEAMASTVGVTMRSEATPAAVSEAMRSEAMPAIEEMRLRYEQGLDLLLNAADLEQSCVAIFNEFAPVSAAALEQALGPSLLKKFKQLELYEVPCYACIDKDMREASTDSSSAAVHSATEQVFAFVQTVGFDTDLEIFSEENVKTFTM